jgi:hypothetical protein
LAAGVVEPAMSKIKSLRFASDRSCHYILRIDDCIQTSPGGSNPMGGRSLGIVDVVGGGVATTSVQLPTLPSGHKRFKTYAACFIGDRQVAWTVTSDWCS